MIRSLVFSLGLLLLIGGALALTVVLPTPELEGARLPVIIVTVIGLVLTAEFIHWARGDTANPVALRR